MRNVIDLFAGAGGLSLGAARAGFTVAAAVEIDKHAIATHKENFPHTIHIEKDIRLLSGEELINAVGKDKPIVGVIGGPPCQGFSTIGHGNVLDERNGLFRQFFEKVAEIQPLFFVAENVPGIMREKYDSIRQEAFSIVKDYILLDPICVNASEYGAPTLRTRYFFVGYRSDSGIELKKEDFDSAKILERYRTKVSAALEGLPVHIPYQENQTGIRHLEKQYTDRRRKHSQSDFFYEHTTAGIPPNVGNQEFIKQYREKHVTNGFLMTNHSAEVVNRYRALPYGVKDQISKSQKLDPNMFCPTLRAGTGPEKGSFQAVRPIHYAEPRVINPREAARLQGFPDWFKLPPTIWHSFRQIGNSVSPIAAEAILKVIYDHLPDADYKS